MFFWTSDNHFGHANIIRYCGRPFASVEEHDAALIDNWNKIVKDKDEVWILGDFSFRDPIPILERLKGRKHLIRGNHDYKNKKAIQWEPPIVEQVFDKTLVVMSHYPLISWRASSHLHSWHFHGHSHGKTNRDNVLAVDVGVDCWNYAPVSWEVLKPLILKKRELILERRRNTENSSKNDTPPWSEVVY